MDPLIKKDLIIRKIREYFYSRGFVEIYPQVLSTGLPYETHIFPFKTEWILPYGKKKTLYLQPYPEPYMKKAIARLYKSHSKFFGIGLSFRNKEDVSKTHHPEFTMLEWYEFNVSYLDLAWKVVDFLITLSKQINKAPVVYVEGQQRSIEKNTWKAVSTLDLFKKHFGISWTDRNFVKEAKKRYNLNLSRAGFFDLIMASYIEPKLKDNYIIFDFPLEASVLCRPKTDQIAERFEILIGGIEVANGNAEPIKKDVQQIERKYDEAPEDFLVDTSYLKAIKSIGVPYSGVGIGLERLFSLLTKNSTILDFYIEPLSDKG